MGVFVAILLRPICKGESCFNQKAPALTEIEKNTQRIQDRCQKFVPKEAKCPSVGVVEPFAWKA